MKISSKAAISNSIGMTLVLIGFCLVTLTFFKQALISEFDRALQERSSYLQRHFEVDEARKVFFRGASYPNQVIIKGVDDRAYVEVLDPEGVVIFKNTKLDLRNSHKGLFRTFETPNGQKLRMHTSKVSKDGFDYTIRAAFEMTRVKEKLNTLMRIFLGLVPLAIILIAVLNFWLAKRSLAPLMAITDEAKNITSENLGKRLAVVNQSDEIGQLTLVLNGFLGRIDRAFSLLRQFTSDASHELRTPITAIKNTCEVSLQSDRPAKDYKKTVEIIHEEALKMADLVESLLLLARGDAGAIKLRKEAFETSDLIRQVHALLCVLSEEKSQKVLCHLTDGEIKGDPSLIRQAVMGILHNAIKFSPEGSTIIIRSTRKNQRLLISVQDQGPGIPKEMEERIFQRFFRVDPDRSRQNGGTGLGLAITKWICEIHSGNVSYVPVDDGGCEFTLSLPLA